MLLVRSYVGEPKSDKNTKFILARRNIQNSKLNIKHKFSTTTTTKSNKKRGFLCKLTWFALQIPFGAFFFIDIRFNIITATHLAFIDIHAADQFAECVAEIFTALVEIEQKPHLWTSFDAHLWRTAADKWHRCINALCQIKEE